MKKEYIITILLVIIVGAGAFFAGMKYQQGKRTNMFRQFDGNAAQQGQRGTGTGNNSRMGFRPINGEIISADNQSITVKLTDNSSKIVILNEKTVLNKASQATASDLKVGEKVMVVGTDNSDGSVTAQSVQMGEMFRGNITTPIPTK